MSGTSTTLRQNVFTVIVCESPDIECSKTLGKRSTKYAYTSRFWQVVASCSFVQLVRGKHFIFLEARHMQICFRKCAEMPRYIYNLVIQGLLLIYIW